MAGYTSGEWEGRETGKKKEQRGNETGQIVKPEPAVERSIVGSMAELIKETPPSKDAAEKVEWVRLLPKDPALPSTVLLAIGLARGYQIWGLGQEGDCEELISDRQGPIKILRLLPKPGGKDKFAEARPLVALVDSVTAVAGRLHSTLSFLSLVTGHHLPPLTFTQPISALHVSDKYLVVAFTAQLSVCDAGTLTELFSIPNTGRSEDGVPVDLGSSWLAYADSKLAPSLQSIGGVAAEQAFPAYAAQLISAASSLRSTVTSISDSFSRSSSSLSPNSSASRTQPAHVTIIHPGTWKSTVPDIHSLPRLGVDQPSPVLFHFPAVKDQPIRWLKMGPNSRLLVVAAESGQYLNVFALESHPGGAPLSTALHLYTLFRGTTPATILHISFSHDSRWVAASTNHGTTHVFPITPYGGPVTLRTHGGAGVVNRQSRYHRSAGIDPRLKPDVAEPSPPFVSSPLSSSPVSRQAASWSGTGQGPILVQAAGKVHQQLLPGGVGAWAGDLSEGLASKRRSSIGSDSAGMGGSSSAVFDLPRTAFAGPKCYTSLYLAGAGGQLWEYGVEVSGSGPSGHTEAPDASFTVSLVPASTWSLQRTKSSPDIRAPLSSHSLLRSTPLPANSSAKAKGGDRNWISQVEMASYESPSRRLWQGPQFTFRTFVVESALSAPVQHKSQPLEKLEDSPQPPSRSGSGKGRGGKVGKKLGKKEALNDSVLPLAPSPKLERTAPMPIAASKGGGQRVPVVLEATSVGSYDPGAGVTTEVCGSWNHSDHVDPSAVDGRLRESIAEAMRTATCANASLKGSSTGGDSDMEDARDSFSDNDSTLLHHLQP